MITNASSLVRTATAPTLPQSEPNHPSLPRSPTSPTDDPPPSPGFTPRTLGSSPAQLTPISFVRRTDQSETHPHHSLTPDRRPATYITIKSGRAAGKCVPNQLAELRGL